MSSHSSIFFFFKQKTAYDLRISDWSSDVCSSDLHGLKDLVRELVGAEISKQQQSSDWGAPQLSEAQQDYAASDVRYLHRLREKMDERLAREHRAGLAQACFDFLPAPAELDLAGSPEADTHGTASCTESVCPYA